MATDRLPNSTQMDALNGYLDTIAGKIGNPYSLENKLNPAYINYDSTHSAISAADVAQITDNKNNISIVDITSDVTAKSGYTVDSTSHLYRQGRHVFGTLVIKKRSGNFSNATQETIATIGTYSPEYQYLGITGFTNTLWAVQNIGYVFVQNSGASGAGDITVSDTATTNNCVKIAIDYVTP